MHSSHGLKMVLIIFLLVMFGQIQLIQGESSNLTEVDLHETLFKRYIPSIMPKTDTSLPILVNIDMNLLSIESIDEKQQTISIRAFLAVEWIDAFLNWVPEMYNNVTSINVKASSIWVPDIALENTFDSPTDLGQASGNANVDSNGNVIMWPSKIYTVACKIFISRFPFDEQSCTYQFLSWTNPSSVLMLDNKSRAVQMQLFGESGEWELLGMSIATTRRPYGNDTWDLLSFTFNLKRKPLFYVMNMIVPVLCISFLNIFCFLLPSGGGERVTLSISIFLTMAVFLTIVNNSMPESSDEVAMFGVYVGLQLLGSALTIILTTISLYLFHRESYKPVSKCFKVLVKLSLITLPEVKNKVKGHVGDGIQNGGSESTVQNANQHKDSWKGEETIIIEKNHKSFKVNWPTVSQALDRLCFVSALIWNVLISSLLFALISN